MECVKSKCFYAPTHSDKLFCTLFLWKSNSVTPKTGCKLAVKNVPTEMSDEEVREQFDSLGSVKDFSRQGESVHVTYSSPEEAKE